MVDRRPDRLALVIVSAASGAYDLLLGALMLGGRGLMASRLGAPLPTPPIHADLNGLFLLAVGAGYILPVRRPDQYRGYLWVMGPLLKGLGCALFVADHVLRHSPPSYLVFAAADGLLAAVTLGALLLPAADR
jgi:hypothetical protein